MSGVLFDKLKSPIKKVAVKFFWDGEGSVPPHPPSWGSAQPRVNAVAAGLCPQSAYISNKLGLAEYVTYHLSNYTCKILN